MPRLNQTTKSRLAFVTAALGAAIAIAVTVSLSVHGAGVAEPGDGDHDGRDFWSFRQLTSATPPASPNDSWSRTPVDRFILAKLREKQLTPNPVADRRTLIRRVYFDLIGLPPTDEEVRAFVADPSPGVYEELVDRLLESPHYGERWARHWLDIARYAESMGFEHDFDYPYAYRYRDFVIRALNDDLPFDQFLRWQIAGDEFDPNNKSALAATAFLTIGAFPTSVTEAEFERARYDQLDDMASTTSVAFLGLTIGCARCHDHKYDPISSRDYYRIISAFGKTIRGQVEVDPDNASETTIEYQGELERCENQIAFFEVERLPAMLQRHLEVAPSDDPVRVLLEAGKRDEALKVLSKTNAWWVKHVKERDDLLKRGVVKKLHTQVSSEGLPKPWHDADDRGFPHLYEKTFFLARGDVNSKQEEVTTGFLPVLVDPDVGEKRWLEQPPAGCRTSYQRRALANWMVDTDHGAGQLVARVAVNRLWQHHFGRGIVGTPNDFGMQGERPTHPELLDWLATELINTGWKLKPIHKLILTSQVYMQSSVSDPEEAKIDPDNKLLATQNVRRLEGEVIRDAMLSISGLLDVTMFGPGTLNEEMRRRSIYFRIKRSRVIPILQAFDLPEPLTSHAQRPTTTVAPQALILLNHPICRSWAEGFAHTLEQALSQSTSEAVIGAYRKAMQRDPTPEELTRGIDFVEAQSLSYAQDGVQNASSVALADLCQSLFCLNEFIYIE